MADSRTLKLEILAETKQFIKDMKDGESSVETFGGKAEKMGKVVGAAFLAATAAAVAYAGKLAVDGVKAAIDDEAAQARLAKSLENVTGATDTQIASVEKQISKLSLAFGVADDDLRPAFQRLATATGSLETANTSLSLALDISAATGKSVEAVSNALGKAYEGNTGALGRLGIGISSADLKSMSMHETIKALSDTFGGAATTKAETFQGKIDRLKVAFDESKESIGFVLLPILEKLMTFINDKIIPGVQAVVDLFSSKAGGLGEKINAVGKDFRDFFQPIIEGFKKAWDKISDAIAGQGDNWDAFLEKIKPIYEWVKKYLVPVFKETLVQAVELAATAISAAIKVIVPVANAVATGVTTLINGIITGINAFIRAYNLINNVIPGAKDLQTIDKIGAVQFTGSNTVSEGNLPFGGTSIGASGGTSGGTSKKIKKKKKVTDPKTGVTTEVEEEVDPLDFSSMQDVYMGSSLYAPPPPPKVAAPGPVGAVGDRAVGGLESGLTIIVQAPSAIDQQGFSNAVLDALNEAERRGTGGGSRILQVG